MYLKVNESKPEALRKVAHDEVLLVTDDELMRGFDYRSLDKTNGIFLLLAKSCAT